jgi:signal transduction histidine kinase
MKLQKKDRTPIFCSVTAKVQYSQNGGIKWIDGVMEDITERKQAEEERCKLEAQLLQAQKMEAIGQLAGGIAHDFNNLLTAVIGYGNLLKSEISTDRLTSYVTQILSAAERAATLTNDLLTFSRKQIINPRPVDLNKLIKEMHKLLSRIIGEDIELSTVLSDKELNTMADSTQIDQVLMNLATNARDAMPKGGNLIISTDYIQLDNGFIRAHGYGKPGHYAILSFEDTGTGIDEKTKKRIFEPFFTTKDVGKGTGLGLAMVYGIIKQHNGYINLYSEPGKGTTFKLYLPLIESKPEDKQHEVSPLAKTGTETILICEDDLHVRGLMKEILEKAGYEIIEAGDGEDSISIFNQHKDRLHLLILDVVMPKKNGKEVYDEIKKAKPDIKVIFVSGYSADIIHKKGIMEEGMEFISKPISPGDFLAKVRDVLDT